MAAFKDKKNGSWYVQFRYTDWRGERQQKLKRGFATKKEAQAWEREFLIFSIPSLCQNSCFTHVFLICFFFDSYTHYAGFCTVDCKIHYWLGWRQKLSGSVRRAAAVFPRQSA